MKLSPILVLNMLSLSLCAFGQESSPAPQDPMAALSAILGGGTNQVVHHSQLKALLPAEYAGMKRSNSEAGKQAAMGMNISYAEAEYAKDESSLQVKISDVSAMGEWMKFAQYAWLQSEMERETDEGYERTTRIDGFPAQETYQTSDRSGSLQIMVDSRFMVEISGNGVEMETMKGLVSKINLNALKNLKPEAPKTK